MSRTPNPIGNLTDDALLTLAQAAYKRTLSCGVPVVVTIDRDGNVYAARSDSAHARTSRDRVVGTYTRAFKPPRIAEDLMKVREGFPK